MATATAIPTETSVTSRVWSAQQDRFFDWCRDGRGSAVVIAVAGAGKTTSLMLAIEIFVRELSVQPLYMVFNKRNQVEAQGKLDALGLDWKQAQVSTFHAKGYSIWRKVAPDAKINKHKLDDICDALQVPDNFRGFAIKAANFARQQLFGATAFGGPDFLDRNAWLDLIDHFDLVSELVAEDFQGDVEPLEREAINWTVRILKEGIKRAYDEIDFEDMIYLPLYFKCKTWQYRVILVDEAQDTNPARRAFVQLLLFRNGRTIWVGDPAQAIYGFTGADSQSLDIIRKTFRATDLPLTVTYRCPKAVVALAQTWVNHIEAHATAPEGTVSKIEAAELLGQGLNEQDAILCRNTAPLVELFWSFLNAGIPAHVEGRDIGEGLIKLVTRWKRVKTTDGLQTRLEEYLKKQHARLDGVRGKELQLQIIDDQVGALLTIIGKLPQGSTIQDLKAKVEEMFYDDFDQSTGERTRKPTLTLSTIHKAKGREWDRVFWYGANRWQPSKFAKLDWQLEQENNLMYVAATRAKSALTEVVVPIPERQKRAA